MNLQLGVTPMVPVYRQIADVLRDKIVSGEISCGEKLPTEQQLSDMFGTSRMTLRKGLRILEEQQLIVQKHGIGAFVTHEMGHGHYRVAVMEIPAATGEYSMTVISELMHAANTAGECDFFHLRTLGVSPEELMRKFQQQKCEGLVAIAPMPQVRKMICGNMFDNIPVIVIGTDCRELRQAGRYVVDSCPDAIEQGIDYLQRLGHNRIAYLSANCEDVSLRVRNRCFLKAARQRGLYMGDGYYRVETVPSWYDAARDYARELCSGGDRPTAILCPGSLFAYGAWQGIMEAGLRIPEDISLLGFDCSPHCNPHLSSVVQPLHEIAAAAARQLLDSLRFRRQPSGGGELFPVEIIDRGSCRKIK